MLEIPFNATFFPVAVMVNEHMNGNFPWLSLSILFPIAGSFLVPFFPDKGEGKEVRWYALGIALATFLITVAAYVSGYESTTESLQLAERVNWLPSLGLAWAVGADGLSMPLILLTSFITVIQHALEQYKPKATYED